MFRKVISKSIQAIRQLSKRNRRSDGAPRALLGRALSFEHLEGRAMCTVVPAGFQETLVTAFNKSSIASDFAPDGRLFVATKEGEIRIVKNGALLPTPFFSTAVDVYRDRGMFSIVIDPNFATNRFVYTMYTEAVPSNPNVANNGAITKLVRIRASATNPDVAEANSAVTILSGIQSPGGIHLGGLLQFGTDGLLYVGVGDGEIPSLAQDLNSIQGKILRLNVAAFPNIIPSTNPYVGQAGRRPEIYAYGFRNPFSGDISSENQVFANDVGSSQWEEVDDILPARNYGWPNAEGVSSNPAYTNPVYTYAHNGAGAAVTGGAFYVGTQFPEDYRGRYYFGDVAQGVIRAYDLATGEAEVFATEVGSVTDLDIGPDGSLFVTKLSFGAPAIYKISYVGGVTQQPTAVATASVTSGLGPLAVTFSGVGSVNPSGAGLRYEWNFGDGTTSQGANVSKTYATNGTYNATLRVTDLSPGGQSSTSSPIVITVGDRAPVVSIMSPSATTSYVGAQTISFSGFASDPDSGALPASAYTWTIRFGHNTHFHDFIAPIRGATSGSFVIPTDGEFDPDQYYRIQLTATDSRGLTTTTFRDIRPSLTQLTLAPSVANLSLLVDDQPLIGPVTLSGVVNMVRNVSAPATQTLNGRGYTFVGWSDGGPNPRPVAYATSPQTLIANYKPTVAPALSASYQASPQVVWRPQSPATFAVTVTNNGTTTWRADGANPVRLGAYIGAPNDSIGSWLQEPRRTNLTQDVAPGQSVTLNVTISPPVTPGPYILRLRMVQEGVAWFQELFKIAIESGEIPSTLASNLAPVLAPGAVVTFNETIRNTGQQVWKATGTNAVHLGSYWNAQGDRIFDWTSEPARTALPYDVAPGQTVQIRVTTTVPQIFGVNVLRNRLVKEQFFWANTFEKHEIAVGSLGAQYVGPAPASWLPSETKTYTYSVRNTGTFSWEASGPRAVRLGVYWDALDDTTFSLVNTPTFATLSTNVAPGATGVFSVTITTPSALGPHTLTHRMIFGANTWFTDFQKATYNFSTTFDAQIVGLGPRVWADGESKAYRVTVTNTGTATWPMSNGSGVQLAVFLDGAATPYVTANLTADVLPGQQASIRIVVPAASRGDHTLKTQMIRNGATFGGQRTEPITVGTLSASYDISNVPTTWLAGETKTYSVTITNTGNVTWNNTGPNVVRLGFYFDAPNDNLYTWATEPSRVLLPTSVAPGASITLQVTAKAPTTPGTYTLRHRMVKEFVTWFTSLGKTTIQVT